MMQDQKCCNNNIRAEDEQVTTARAKLHEDEEQDTGVRPYDIYLAYLLDNVSFIVEIGFGWIGVGWGVLVCVRWMK